MPSSPVSKVKSARLAGTPIPSMVARQVEAMILDGRLKTGNRMPSERSLCRQLKVSRNTLREALQELRGRGVVQTRRGSGTYVMGALDPNLQALQPSAALQSLLQAHPGTLADLLEVRRLLEGEAAFQAAKRATEDDLDVLSSAYQAVVDPSIDHDSSNTWAQRDVSFHQAIYAAAHNPILLLALNGIRDLMMSFIFSTSDRLYSRLARRQLCTQHRRIYRAIEKRDAIAARRAAIEHIDAVGDAMKPNL